MKKMVIVFACMVLIGSLGLAQAVDIDTKNSNNLAADIYIPVEIIEMPKTPSPPIKDLDAPLTTFRSQNGASKNYSEHLLWCNAHREYSFQTKKWTIIPAKPEWLCIEQWGRYLQTKNKIGYNPLDSPIYSKEVRK